MKNLIKEMKFTKEIKEKIWQIAEDCIVRDKPDWKRMPVGDANSFRLDWFENKGYPIIKKQCVYNTKTKRWRWGRKPNSSKSIFFLLGQAYFPTDVRIRYWLEVPNEIAEKILILGYVPNYFRSKEYNDKEIISISCIGDSETKERLYYANH